jgi:L-asparaginase / beta-aspartyl-peptidase
MSKPYALAIHGGAGTLLRSQITPEKEQLILAALHEALEAGKSVLASGGKALDAVTASVVVLEDSELFNAGKGSVFTHEGTHELDASVMCGETRLAGAVSSVKHIKNPVVLSRKVMESSEHVLLTGEGAEEFARQMGMEFVSNRFFSTEFRKKQWEEALSEGRVQLDHSDKEKKFGTVGAVALDINGNLAAATSTGGMTNKRYGRVGDSPLIGCGTYASNDTCAVSCTGWGEYFIKNVAAYDVAARMRYGNQSLRQATNDLVMNQLHSQGADGGLIAIDREGNIELVFNTPGMYRGSVSDTKAPEALIF